MINDARERRIQKVTLFQCEECQFKSGSRTLLNRHKQAIHEGDKYSCNQCDFKAKIKENLKKRQSTVHEKRMYQCNQCDYKDASQGNVNKHTKSIHDPQENMIESNENLQKKKKYVPKRIQCSKCEKKFNKKETHETHVKTQHKETTLNLNLNESEDNNVHLKRPSNLRPRKIGQQML